MSSPCWARGVAAAGPRASLRGDTELQGRDRTAETLKYSQSLSYFIPFSFLGQLSAVGINRQSPKPLHIPAAAATGTVRLPQSSCRFLSNLQAKLYQDSKDYQGNFREDQPKSSLFLHNWQSAEIPVGSWWAVCTEARCAAATRSGATGAVVGNSVYSGFRQAALVQLTGSGVSSHPQEKKKKELEVCWKEWGWEGWAGRGFLPSPCFSKYRIISVFITALPLFITDLLWGSIQFGVWSCFVRKEKQEGELSTKHQEKPASWYLCAGGVCTGVVNELLLARIPLT